MPAAKTRTHTCIPLNPFSRRHILKIGEWAEYGAGDVIQEPHPSRKCEYFHILFAGVAEVVLHSHGRHSEGTIARHRLYPMDVFDLSLGNHFGVYTCAGT